MASMISSVLRIASSFSSFVRIVLLRRLFGYPRLLWKRGCGMLNKGVGGGKSGRGGRVGIGGTRGVGGVLGAKRAERDLVLQMIQSMRLFVKE